MEKKGEFLFPWGRSNIVLMMKLLVVLMLSCGMTLQASSILGQKVSVRVSKGSLQEILHQVKQQTGHHFLLIGEESKKLDGLDVQLEDISIEQLLEVCLKNTSLAYAIVDKTILISDRTGKSPQEKIRIKGKVVTEGTKQPLAGAAVYVKGSTVGTITDGEGEFTLLLDSKPMALMVTFLGMNSREVLYEDQKELYIELSERVHDIAEVVVSTGYQQVDKRVLTSSVFSITGEDILQSNAGTIDNMLQGKIPGLLVMNSSSTPGAATKLRIRGTSTISGNREPLWVVDGIILDDPVSISTEELNNLDNVNIIANAISGLNPMDIQRIDFLKDASATAIYGVRAANGVIVITTKKGDIGEPRVNYSGTFTLTGRPSYNDLYRMNSLQRIDVSKEIEERGLTYNFTPAPIGYEGLLYDLYNRKLTYDEFLVQTKRLEEMNTDWFDMLFRTSFTHKHNLSISGANDKINYYFSAAYTDDRANVKGTGLKQYNASMKLGANFSEKLMANVQLRYARTDKDYLHSSINAYKYAYSTSRALPAYNEDGSLAYYTMSRGSGESLLYNVLNETEYTGREVTVSSFNFVANLEWKIIKGLRASGTLGLNDATTTEKEWFDERSYVATKLRNVNYGSPLPDKEATDNYCYLPYGGGLKNADTRNYSHTARAQLDYSGYYEGGHSVTAVVGTEVRSTTYKGTNTSRWGYLPNFGETFVDIDPALYPKYKKMIMSNPTIVTNRLTNTVSYYGIATYEYKRKYIFNANIRADGSNKFGQDKSTRFLPIWSVSGRWNIHNESILKDVMWIDELALKASYGVQGNVSDDQTPNLTAQRGGIDGMSGEYYLTLSKLPNAFLKWEKTNSYNVALDFSLFEGRLSASVEYYYKKGRDMIVSKDVSPTTGSTYISVNAGDMMNKGYELILNAVPIRKENIRWSISLNGAKNVNEVTRGGTSSDFTYSEYINGSTVLKGDAINTFYSYKFDGLDSEGLPTFKDMDADGFSGMSSRQMFERVLTKSGNRVPDIQGGFGTNFSYRDFSLNLFFSYSLGSKIRMNELYSNSGQYLPDPYQNMTREFVNRWRKPGDESWAVIPTLSTDRLSVSKVNDVSFANNMWQMYNQSDLRVVSGDFLRLRTASLRYNLPKDVCKKVGIKSAGIRIEGNNLWLLSSGKLKGQDPEQVSFGGEGNVVPPMTSFSLGIDVSF